MKVHLCYLPEDWDKIKEMSKGKGISAFIHIGLSEKLKSVACDNTPGVMVSKSVTIHPSLEKKLKCQAEQLGIRPGTYVSQYVIDPKIKRD